MVNVLPMLYQNEKTLCNLLIIKALYSFLVNPLTHFQHQFIADLEKITHFKPTL